MRGRVPRSALWVLGGVLLAAVVAAVLLLALPGTSHVTVPAVGGTKDPDVPAIVELRPDLVVLNDEENRYADAASLIAEQVRSGLVVRMAVLYDLLTQGPLSLAPSVNMNEVA